ncbi:response regulator transcription factor [Pelagicoccus sp. SDUM812005]|uniref:response regulator transcription factor n=1 Tax=Pelagicoccus sp. SDUM812005 TaxID=3041257 RepID=UPI00280EC857|nr:response regulator transcription factor [Pelagicoccus sp. SDUM812005]MDQ8180252.1 response regulator transcription factor [Pelagicoccus sp. SDUM812005]
MTKADPSTDLPRVCLVEDHAEFRDTLREALESTDRFAIDAVLSNAEDLFEYLNDAQAPDILILDLGLPGMDGLEAIPQIRKVAPETKILVLTVFDNKARVFQALGAGASGYLIKSDGLKAIVQGIEDACHGIAPLSADIAKMVFNTFSNFKPASPEEDLSEREAEVLKQLADGLSRQEVADKLFVSKHTVSTHIRNIYQKLQVHNVSGAISKAASMGII